MAQRTTALVVQELAETDSVYDTEKLSERIAKLSGGVAVVKVRARGREEGLPAWPPAQRMETQGPPSKPAE